MKLRQLLCLEIGGLLLQQLLAVFLRKELEAEGEEGLLASSGCVHASYRI